MSLKSYKSSKNYKHHKWLWEIGFNNLNINQKVIQISSISCSVISKAVMMSKVKKKIIKKKIIKIIKKKLMMVKTWNKTIKAIFNNKKINSKNYLKILIITTTIKYQTIKEYKINKKLISIIFNMDQWATTTITTKITKIKHLRRKNKQYNFH